MDLKPTIKTDYAEIYTGYDNLAVLKTIPNNLVDMTYLDPPYLTNKTWEKNGWSFDDKFDDMWHYLFFLAERYVEAKRIMRTRHYTIDQDVILEDGQPLTYQPRIDYIKEKYMETKSGLKKLDKGLDIGASIFTHVDYRTNNEIKTYLLDPLFGEGKTTLEWGEVQALFKIKLGKKVHTPVDVPERIIEQGPDLVCDYFAGSLSMGVEAYKTGRRFLGIEMNKTEQLYLDAIEGKEFGCDRED